jgi:hypothetical protein
MAGGVEAQNLWLCLCESPFYDISDLLEIVLYDTEWFGKIRLEIWFLVSVRKRMDQVQKVGEEADSELPALPYSTRISQMA